VSFEDTDEVEDRIVEDLVLNSIKNLLISMQARKGCIGSPKSALIQLESLSQTGKSIPTGHSKLEMPVFKKKYVDFN
jgi:hypothetical protein